MVEVGTLRHIALAMVVLVAADTAYSADSARCRDLVRRYETDKHQMTAIEVSTTLFAAADRDCINLATTLLDQGASVDARDRLGARPLSRAARSGHLAMVDLLLQRGAPIDARNLAIEHGPSAFDVRRRFVGLFALDVPAGPLPRVVAGWRVAGIVILQSGSPFTVVYGGPDTSGFNQQTQGISPDGGNRPNVVKPGPLPENNRNPDAAFDTSWFAPNLAGQDGTSGRNAYRGPALSNTNFSVSKSFPLGDAVRLQFRTDFFNLFNHSNFANPIADLNNANFGRITQTLGSAVSTSVATSGAATGGPRVIQLALRLQF